MLRPTPMPTHKCKHSTHTHTQTPFSHSLRIGGESLIGSSVVKWMMTVLQCRSCPMQRLAGQSPPSQLPEGHLACPGVPTGVCTGQAKVSKHFSYFCQPPLTRQQDRNPRRDWSGPKKDRADRPRSAGSDKSSKPVADVWVPGHQNMEASSSAAYRLEIWGCTRLL